MELSAQKRIVIRCGDSAIELTPEAIILHAKRIELCSEDRTELQHGPRRAVGLAYDGTFSMLAETITLASVPGASLVLDADAKLDGALVKLNCGGAGAGGRGEPGLVGETGEAVFRLDSAGIPPGSPFVFVIGTPEGERLEREIVPGGEIRMKGRPGDRFVLIEARRDGKVVKTRKHEPGAGR
jgi:hypothetical protein